MANVVSKRPAYLNKEKSLARNISGDSLMRNTSAESLNRNASNESLHNALTRSDASRSSSGLSMVPFRNFMQMVRVQSPETADCSTPTLIETAITVQSDELKSVTESTSISTPSRGRKRLLLKAWQRKHPLERRPEDDIQTKENSPEQTFRKTNLLLPNESLKSKSSRFTDTDRSSSPSKPESIAISLVAL